MQHFASLQDVNIKDSWLTIGSFDGVHLGHRQILKELTAGAQAQTAPAVVLTFDPHPAIILKGPRDGFYLTTPQEKAELLGQVGVDIVITQPFDQETAQMSASDFMSRVKDSLGIKQLWIGHDFTLGRNRQGDAAELRKIGKSLDYDVHVIPPVIVEEQIVSSNLIRRLLVKGEVEQASDLLSRPYVLPGRVEAGVGRGRTIGFPTANLAISKERVVPGIGVYVCQLHVGDQKWDAVTNIGVRPTFESNDVAPSVEAYILDFEGALYDQQVRLDFLARLRNEIRFSGEEELVAQMHLDIAKARQIFEKHAQEEDIN